MRTILRTLIAVTPLTASLLLRWAVVTGYFPLSNGTEVVFLVLPALLWSSLFLLCYVALWWQGFPSGQSTSVSVGFATGPTALAWIALFVFSWLPPG